MKNNYSKLTLLLSSLFFLIATTVFSQNIVVDGTNVLAAGQAKFPIWLRAGQTLAVGTNVSSISVIEYNVVSSPSGGNVLTMGQVIKVTTVQTVPANTTWKVEAVLLDPIVSSSGNGWTDDGTVVRLTTNTDNVGIGNSTPTQKLDITGKLALSGKEALDGGDTWLRLNQSSQFSSGTYSPGFLRADGGIASGGLGSLGAGTFTATGVINSNAGYQLSNGAASGNYLRGNGTSFVSSAIQAGDLPGGNGNYIQNQVASAQTANYWITGEARTNDWFRNLNVNTGLYNDATGRHFYSESGSYWTIADANGLIFRNALAGTTTGYVYWDGTAGSNNFGLLSPSGNWRVRVSNGDIEMYAPMYTTTTYIPYIYDRDNNGYYMDPNGSSYTNYFGRNYGYNWTEYDWNNSVYYVDPNNVSVFQDVRPSIMYDRDNTGYYIDMNSGSYCNYFGRNYGWNWTEYDWNNSSFYENLDNTTYHNYQGRNYGFNWTEYDWNNSAYYVDPNNVSIFSDIRSQIWYDYNNTGYYIDGNNGSNLNYATANDWYVNNWFRVNGGGGIYWQAYGGGWYMQDGTYIRSYNNKTVYNYRGGYPAAVWDGDRYCQGYWATETYSCNSSYYANYNSGYVYATTYGYLSTRKSKKDIQKFDEDDYKSSLEFVDKLDLNYYVRNDDDFGTTRVGFIAEETPGPLTVTGKEGVLYGELAIYNTGAIRVLKKRVEDLEQQLSKLSDFGISSVSGAQTQVSYSSNFKSLLGSAVPVVVLTPSTPNAIISVSNVSSTGFTVVSSNASAPVSFSWIAMAEAQKTNEAAKPGYSTRFAKMIESAEYDVANRPLPIRTGSQTPVTKGGDANGIAGDLTKTDYDPAKFHAETKNKPETKIDPADANAASEKLMVKPSDDHPPEETKITPPEETKREIIQRAEDDLKKFVPVDESSPLKGDPNPSKEGAPKR